MRSTFFALFHFLILSIPSVCFSQIFTEYPNDTLIQLKMGIGEWFDYDRDNDYDLVFIGDISTPSQGLSRGNCVIFENQSGGSFEKVIHINEYATPFATAFYGDELQTDSTLLLVGNDYKYSLHFEQNVLSRNRHFFSPPLKDPINLLMIDFDNDGYLDGGFSGPVYKNYRDYTFSKVYPYLGGLYRSDRGIKSCLKLGDGWMDFDQDGDMDMVMAYIARIGTSVACDPQRQPLSFYENKGNWNFFSRQGHRFTQWNTGNFIPADFNEDGYIDLLIQGGYREVHLFLNEEGRGFSEGIPIDDALYGDMAIGDYDNDGDWDILTGGNLVAPGTRLAGWRLFENRGLDSFVLVDSAYFENRFEGSIRWGDMDGDSDLDILMTGISLERITDNKAHLTKIFVNSLDTPNEAPNPPSNLRSVVTGNSVELFWDPGNDPTTPSLSLTYNLFLHREGESWIFPVDSDTLNGELRRPIQGNLRTNRYWKFTDLAPGLYKWGLQSVDAGYKGSTFTSQCFWIGEPSPYIASLRKEINLPSKAHTYILPISIPGAASTAWDISVLHPWIQPQVLSGIGQGQLALNISENAGALRSNRLTIFSTQADSSVLTLNFTQTGTDLFSITDTLGLPQLALDAKDFHRRPTHNWVDHDLDGDLDLLHFEGDSDIHIRTDSFFLFKNHGDFEFHRDTLITLPTKGLVGAEWEDIDSDGDLDLIEQSVVEDVDEVQVHILENIGENEWRSVFGPIQRGDRILGFSTFDYNFDGKPDMFIEGDPALNRNEKNLWDNQGDFNFTQNSSIRFNQDGAYLWADWDGDQLTDLLVVEKKLPFSSNPTANNVIFYKNKDGHSFFERQYNIYSLPDISPIPQRLDSDLDGDWDLAINGFLLINDGKGNFALKENTGIPKLKFNLSWVGDLDNDGYPDAISSERYTNTRRSDSTVLGIYLNNGDNSFRPATFWYSGYTIATQKLVPADIDQDGKLEFPFIGQSYQRFGKGYGGIFFAENQSNLSNTPPSPPSNISSTSSFDTVFLSYDAGTDIESPSSGLTYNLYLYQNGGDTLVSSMSRKTDGRLYKPFYGNQEKSRRKILILPEAGTYSWAVQSIDPGFRGSSFSAESSFSLSPVIQWDSMNMSKIANPMESYKLTWKAAYIDCFKLEYRSIGSTEWISIVESLPKDIREFPWELPLTDPGTYEIKVGSCTDTYTDTFSLEINPQLSITRPSQIEIWEAGSEENISWESNITDNLSLFYRDILEVSRKNPIASPLSPANSSYIWSIPTTFSEGKYVLDIQSDQNPTQSDSALFVVVPDVSIVSPNRQEPFLLGDSIAFQLQTTSPTRINISYRIKGEDIWVPLVESLHTSNKKWSWPTQGMKPGRYEIQIRSSQWNYVHDSISNIQLLPNPITLLGNNDLPFRVYPNPTSSLLQLMGDIEVLDDAHLSLFRFDGSKLKSIKAIPDQSLSIDMSAYPSGIYLLHIITQESVHHSIPVIKN